MTPLPWTDPRHPWMRDSIVLDLPPRAEPRRCEHCGADLSHRTAAAVYCSPRCARRSRHADRLGLRRVASCVQCGGSLDHRFISAHYCSRLCGQRGLRAGRLVRLTKGQAQ